MGDLSPIMFALFINDKQTFLKMQSLMA